jgi:hypothetical protein
MVLELPCSSETSGSQDLFNFPFGFSFYDVRWWFNEILPMLFCLLVRRKEGCVENIVNFPLRQQFQLVCDGGYYGGYHKQSIPPWG